jgi:hypothetical protein
MARLDTIPNVDATYLVQKFSAETDFVLEFISPLKEKDPARYWRFVCVIAPTLSKITLKTLMLELIQIPESQKRDFLWFLHEHHPDIRTNNAVEDFNRVREQFYVHQIHTRGFFAVLSFSGDNNFLEGLNPQELVDTYNQTVHKHGYEYLQVSRFADITPLFFVHKLLRTNNASTLLNNLSFFPRSSLPNIYGLILANKTPKERRAMILRENNIQSFRSPAALRKLLQRGGRDTDEVILAH